MANTLARTPVIVQVIFVVACATAFVLGTDALGFRSPANALWMIALPVLLGAVLNPGWRRRTLMAAALLAVSAATVMLVGVNFTTYG